MACTLTKGDGVFDAIGQKGNQPVVFIRSDAAPGVVVISATYAGAKLDIDQSGKMTLPPLQTGTKDLAMVIDGVRAGDDVELFEDCPASEELSRAVVGSAPGGADLRIGFRIHV